MELSDKEVKKGSGLYMRVSTEGQAREEFSLPEQKTRLEDYCRVKGYEIGDYYSDEGISAKKGNYRPEFERLKEDIKNLKECNDTLQLRVDTLSEKVDKQEKQIDEYRKDIFNLKFQLQELQQLFEKLINFLKRLFHRKDKEAVYAEVVGDLYDNQIISEKNF